MSGIYTKLRTNTKTWLAGLLGCPEFKTLPFQCRGCEFDRSLVRELRSHMPRGVAKKKKWLETLKEYIFCIISFSELIKTADGGQISLDWFDNDNSKRYMDASTRPTVLLLPGLTGTSKESYILHMIHLSEELGYRYPWMISFIFPLIHFKWGFTVSTFVSEILVISFMD